MTSIKRIKIGAEDETNEINRQQKWWCDNKIINPKCRLYAHTHDTTTDEKKLLTFYPNYQECESKCAIYNRHNNDDHDNKNSYLNLPHDITRNVLSEFIDQSDIAKNSKFYQKFSPTIYDKNYKSAERLYNLWETSEDKNATKAEFLNPKNAVAVRFALDALLSNTRDQGIFQGEYVKLLFFIFENPYLFHLINKRRWLEIFDSGIFNLREDFLEQVLNDPDLLKNGELLFSFIDNVNKAEKIGELANFIDHMKIIEEKKKFIEQELLSANNLNDHEKANILSWALQFDPPWAESILFDGSSKYIINHTNIAIEAITKFLHRISTYSYAPDDVDEDENEEDGENEDKNKKWLLDRINILLKNDATYGVLKLLDAKSILILMSLLKYIMEDKNDLFNLDVFGILLKSGALNDKYIMSEFIYQLLMTRYLKYNYLNVWFYDDLLTTYNELFTNLEFQNYFLSQLAAKSKRYLEDQNESKEFDQKRKEKEREKKGKWSSIIDLQFLNMIPWHPKQLKIINNYLMQEINSLNLIITNDCSNTLD